MSLIAEKQRLQEAREQKAPWRKWGPYLSERQWGTVREDYSEGGNAWDYFSHDQARSRAYRWGEDGLAGISDDKQRLCFALALWNGKDPILKERLFGLTNSEGNHGEDVKEYYFYLDSTPTHSYMKYLYKYPQAAYPYDDLIRPTGSEAATSSSTNCSTPASSIRIATSTSSWNTPRGRPRTSLSRSRVQNRGPEPETLHVLPTLLFRNRWSWGAASPRPRLRQAERPGDVSVVEAVQERLGTRYLYCDGKPALLFTENETNTQRVFGVPNGTPYVKDGINNYLVQGQQDAVNPSLVGTKAAPHYPMTVGPGESSRPT